VDWRSSGINHSTLKSTICPSSWPSLMAEPWLLIPCTKCIFVVELGKRKFWRFNWAYFPHIFAILSFPIGFFFFFGSPDRCGRLGKKVLVVGMRAWTQRWRVTRKISTQNMCIRWERDLYSSNNVYTFGLLFKFSSSFLQKARDWRVILFQSCRWTYLKGSSFSSLERCSALWRSSGTLFFFFFIATFAPLKPPPPKSVIKVVGAWQFHAFSSIIFP